MSVPGQKHNKQTTKMKSIENISSAIVVPQPKPKMNSNLPKVIVDGQIHIRSPPVDQRMKRNNPPTSDRNNQINGPNEMKLDNRSETAASPSEFLRLYSLINKGPQRSSGNGNPRIGFDRSRETPEGESRLTMADQLKDESSKDTKEYEGGDSDSSSSLATRGVMPKIIPADSGEK